MGAGGAEGSSVNLNYCQAASYSNRLDNPDAYDWCVVPNTSYDVVLFGGVAVVLACLLQGKLNTLMVLCAGAVLMAIAWPVNLGALGNSLAIWLGISPWQLFFYVFLPPLLLDAAVRIDWFVFKKNVAQVLTLAFLVVGATCVAMIPLMLYVLDLRKYGWEWIHACMFGAMIASTDAVAIVSIMKTSGGPKRLRVLLEGESLLNDASGLTLFEVFFHILQHSYAHPEQQESVNVMVGQVFLAVFQLGTIGLVMGIVFGVLTRLFLRFMRYAGAGHDQEVALTLGMAYLAYWITGVPCKGSGVVAVAVMGLYGASTNCWDMSTAAHHTFDGFWETLAFTVNSLVFMYSGASVVNFFIRASGDLKSNGPNNDLDTTLWMLPIIYLLLMLLRFVLTVAFRPLFMALKGDIDLKETVFVTIAGLRGSASLIMGSAVVTAHFNRVAGSPDTFSVVKAMMVFWTAGFVLLTLLINAPLLPTLLRVTGLSKVPEKQLERRRRAVAALNDYSGVVLNQLRDAEDELLAGVDWAQVSAFVDHSHKYTSFTGQPRRIGWFARWLLRMWRLCCCCCPCLPSWLAPKLEDVDQEGGHHHEAHGRHHHHSASSQKGKAGGKRRASNSRHHSHHGKHGEGGGAAVAAGPAAAAGSAGMAAGDKDVSNVPVVHVDNGNISTSQAPLYASPAARAADGRGDVSNVAQAPTGAANGTAAAAAAAFFGGSQAASGSGSSNGASSWDENVHHPGQQQRLHHADGRRHRRQRRQGRQQERRVSGDVSDSEGSSDGSDYSDSSSSISSYNSSSGSGSSRVRRFESNLIYDVLPFLQQTDSIDVLQQECPFFGNRLAVQQQRLAAVASTDLVPTGAAAATAAGEGKGQQVGEQRQHSVEAGPGRGSGRSQGSFGALGRFFLRGPWRKAVAGGPRGGSSRRKQGPASASDVELQLQDGSGNPPARQSSPLSRGAAGPASESGGSAMQQLLPSAFAAAAASRTAAEPSAAAAASAAGGSTRGRSNSLATRSAAPAFIYGALGDRSSSKTEAAPGRSSYNWPPAPLPEQSAEGGLGGGSNWVSSFQARESIPGSPRAAGGSGGSIAFGRAPLEMGTEKALGRQSGIYRSLASKSVSLVDSVVSSAGPVPAEGFSLRGTHFQPFHLPEGNEASFTSPRSSKSISGGYGASSGFGGRALNRISSSERDRSGQTSSRTSMDAAALAVNMVALERSSSRKAAAAMAGAGRGGNSSGNVSRQNSQGLSRAGSRGLSSRSMGLAGAYGGMPDVVEQRSSAASASPFEAQMRHIGSDGNLSGRNEQQQPPGAFPPPTGVSRQRVSPAGSGDRGLATRSINPHLPPVAPVAPSLYTISTGLAGYREATHGPSPAAEADASHSRGAAAGGSLPWAQAGSKAERSLASRSVPAAGIVAAAAAAATAAAATAAAAAAGGKGSLAGASTTGSRASNGGGGRTESVLGILRSSMKLGTRSGKSGRGGALGGSSEDESSGGLNKGSAFARGSSSLAGTSAFELQGSQSAGQDVEPAALADARSWLVTSLKRYFLSKRMEGLLSARGLRILDSGCEVLLERPERPMRLWGIISGDCANSLMVHLMTYSLFGCRQAAVGLMTLGRVGRALSWPLRLVASMLQRPLNKVLLSSVEVAMEYHMGLTTSPYVEWLQESESWSALLPEISREAGLVAQFLIDREIEAPERYSAVQSYRVAMSVLRQQRLFVETLFESGMLDSSETSMLAHPIEAAERRLELLGPVWRAPGLGEVLRQLPFMRGQPQSVVEFFIKHGQLMMFGSGSSLPVGTKELYVVQSGIVKVTYSPDLGEVQEYFLGCGGLFNLYSGLTGEKLPGASDAIAQGNALGKGPVLFCLSAKGLRRLAAAAAAGDPAYQQLELDMYRLAGIFLLQRLKPQFEVEVSQALARLAPLTTTPGHTGTAAAAAGAAAGGGGQPAKRSSRQQRTVWVRQRLAALQVLLKQQLNKAELLVLPPGLTVMQESHMVLMKGSIQVKVPDDLPVMSNHTTAEVVRWMVSAGRHSNQSILPWLWDLLSEEDLRQAPAGVPLTILPVTVTAGPEGATLLVGPSAAEEAAMAAAAAAASGRSDSLHPATSSLLQPLVRTRSGSQAQPGVSGPPAWTPQAQPGGNKSLVRHSPGELARTSPVGLAAAAAQAGLPPGAAATAAHRALQNTYSRRSLAAAAAAADALMDPLPGTPAAGRQAAGAVRPASLEQQQQQTPAPVAAGGSNGLSRVSSSTPLAGASIDNMALLGVDHKSSGHLAALGVSEAAAAAGEVHHPAAVGLDVQQQQQAGAAGTATAAGGGDSLHPAYSAAALPGGLLGPASSLQQQQLRRSRSQRPLRAGVADVGERRGDSGTSGGRAHRP